MPLMDQTQLAGNYSFSAARIDTLGATEYTLVTIALDRSGSTVPFRAEMEKALQSVVGACKKSPRADNLMLRVVHFDSYLKEVHGFKLLADCNPSDYAGCLGADGGMTALYDALYEGVKAMDVYGEKLTQADFSCNAVLFVITDGQDNASRASKKMVADALAEMVSAERVESLSSILISLGTGVSFASLASELGISQLVEVGHASPEALAKLGRFISQSISSSSQALGTGGPSQSLVF